MATLTKSYQLIGSKTYTVVGSNVLRLYGKYNSQSTANNKTNVTFQLRTVATSGSFYSEQNYSALYCGADRGTQYYNIGTVDTSGEKTIGTWTFDLTHNSNGAYSGSVKASANVYGDLVPSVEVSFSLPTISRYATITEYKINYVTQDTIQVKWNANVNCSELQYSLNNGSWVSLYGTTFNITGLKSGTTYNVKIRVKRADSGLWTTSGTLTTTTLDYIVKTKISDIWKDAIPYIKVNGSWKKATPYIKANDVWNKGV